MNVNTIKQRAGISSEMKAYRILASLLVATMPREERRRLEDTQRRIQEVVVGAGDLGEIALLSVAMSILDEDGQKEGS